MKNKKLLFKLNLQLFAEDEQDDKTKETDIVKTIKDEYEIKLEKQKTDYENKIKIMQEEHAKQIKIIISGRGQSEETTTIEKEKSFEEELLDDTRKSLGLKGGKN